MTNFASDQWSVYLLFFTAYNFRGHNTCPLCLSSRLWRRQNDCTVVNSFTKKHILRESTRIMYTVASSQLQTALDIVSQVVP